VHALGDREDLVLQRVGVVTDNAELDGRDRHLLLSWYAFFPVKELAIRFTRFKSSYPFILFITNGFAYTMESTVSPCSYRIYNRRWGVYGMQSSRFI
jgi:hypothetical protein